VPQRGVFALRVHETLHLLVFAMLYFVVFFVAWPWEYGDDSALTKYYTPLLGLTLGIALLSIGVAVIIYAKKLLPEEVAVQDRHDGASPDDERAMTGATLVNMAVDEIGVHRRPLLKGAIALGLLPVAAVPVVALGGLINDPHDEDQFHKTGFAPGENGEKIRLIRENETPIRPEEISVGGQITVFPGIPNGTTNEHADSAPNASTIQILKTHLGERRRSARGRPRSSRVTPRPTEQAPPSFVGRASRSAPTTPGRCALH